MPFIIKYTAKNNTHEPNYKPHQSLIHRGRSIDSGGHPSQIAGLNKNHHIIHNNPFELK